MVQCIFFLVTASDAFQRSNFVRRWGELASQTPPDHPLVQAIWLKFFFRFIFLPPDGGSSLGCRYGNVCLKCLEVREFFVASL